jgi:hypothetical protein
MTKHLSKHPLNSKPLTESFEKISNIIRYNPNMQIQEQFGSNEKLTTIVIRYNNQEYSSYESL